MTKRHNPTHGLVAGLLLASLLLAGPPSLAQSVEMLDLTYGFKGVRLGSALSERDTVVKIGDYEKKERYRIPTQPSSFQDVPLQFIDYLYYQDTLHSVFIRARGKANATRLLDALQDLYGPGKKHGFAERYTWNGERVKMTYEQNLLTGNADVIILSRKENQRFREDWRVYRP